MNVKREESDMYEADDLLASVARKFYRDFDEIRIITGDRDLLQLVNGRAGIYKTGIRNWTNITPTTSIKRASRQRR